MSGKAEFLIERQFFTSRPGLIVCSASDLHAVTTPGRVALGKGQHRKDVISNTYKIELEKNLITLCSSPPDFVTWEIAKGKWKIKNKFFYSFYTLGFSLPFLIAHLSHYMCPTAHCPARQLVSTALCRWHSWHLELWETRLLLYPSLQA